MTHIIRKLETGEHYSLHNGDFFDEDFPKEPFPKSGLQMLLISKPRKFMNCIIEEI